MKERPIIFSAPMVRAILAGTKTMTRRVCKRAMEHNGLPAGSVHPDGSGTGWISWWPGPVSAADTVLCYPGAEGWKCPYGVPGDRLWVKETWQYADWTEDGRPFIRYCADGDRVLREQTPSEWAERLTDTWAELSEPKNYAIDNRAADRRWRPSIFMPQWASRIDLEVTGVRVERLHEITEDDARAEGIGLTTPEGATVTDMVPSPRRAFCSLWDSINEPRGFGWVANPWVWCVSFKRTAP